MGAFDRVQEAAKSVMGALATVIVSVLFTTVTDPDAVVNPDAPASAGAVIQLPNTKAEWVTMLVAVAVGFLLPYLKRNFPSVVKAQDDLQLAEKRVAAGKQSA